MDLLESPILAVLDTVHHQELRLALGAFRTSPVETYVEADEPSLYLRREKLALQYAIRLAAYPSNPAYEITFPPHISEDIVNLYENKPNVIKSFGLKIQPLSISAHCAPLVADLFLFCYERDFMTSLSDVKQAEIIEGI